MRFISYNNRAIELQRNEPYAIQFEFSALAILYKIYAVRFVIIECQNKGLYFVIV